MNRALRLEEASLRSPDRIDRLARDYGMQPPQAGQVIRMDSSSSDAGAPVMASADLGSLVISIPLNSAGTGMRIFWRLRITGRHVCLGA